MSTARWILWNGGFALCVVGLCLATWRASYPIARKIAWVGVGLSLAAAVLFFAKYPLYPLTWGPWLLITVSTTLKLRVAARVPERDRVTTI